MLVGKLGYLIVCCAAFSLVYGLSSEMMGLNDRELVYNRVFDLVSQVQTMPELLDLANSRITSGNMFFIITWIISRFTSDYNIYLFVLGIFFNAAVTYYIGRYSNDPRMSFIIYLSLIYPLSFTIVRQFTAMVFIVLTIDMLYRKKHLLALAFFAVSIMIHLSVLVLILILFLRKVKFHKLTILLVPVGVLLGMYGGNYIFRFMSFIVTDETYSSRYAITNGKGMAITAIAIRLGILLFLLVLASINSDWFSKEDVKRIVHKKPNKNHNLLKIKWGDHEWVYDHYKISAIEPDVFLWSSLISTIFVSLMNVLGEFQRMATFYDINLVVSIPRAVGTLKKRDGFIASVTIIVLFIVYFLYFQLDNWNIRQYHFFWQHF